MERRYTILKEMGVKNVASFTKMLKNAIDNPQQLLKDHDVFMYQEKLHKFAENEKEFEHYWDDCCSDDDVYEEDFAEHF